MLRKFIGLAASVFIMAGVAQSAIAADLPVKAWPAPSPAVFSWSGFYLGGHGGYGSARKEWSDPFGPPFDAGSHTATGWLGGVQAGANYQIGNVVLGVEGQFSWADLKGSHNSPFEITDTLSTKVTSVATAAGRIGYAFDRTLLYAKVGGAWIRDKHSVIDLGVIEGLASATRSGWLVGAGVEYAIWNNLSAKLEYNYMDFGTRRQVFVDPAGGAPGLFDIRQNLHAVLLGLNYRFMPFP